jgi:phenylacetic acid degradation operon negative regulatory protein
MAESDRPRAALRPGPARPFDDDVDQVLKGLADASPRLPRRQIGSAPQNLAVTLIADFTLHTRAWLPSAAIVALLTQFDLSVANARTAISRLARRGVLETEKQGRNTFYRLSESSAAHLVLGGRHLAGHPMLAEKWDGNWTLVAFSLPNEHSAERRALRSQLRWQGYAPLYDGLWVHPAPLGRIGAESLADIAPGRLSVFRAEHRSFAVSLGRAPLDAWDLAGISARYLEFLASWQAQLGRPDFARLSGAEALRARTAVIEQYRLLPLLDPPLPLAVMPPDWPRVPAHDTLAAVYDGLAGSALRHVLSVIADVSSTEPTQIRTHTVAEMAAGVLTSELTSTP